MWTRPALGSDLYPLCLAMRPADAREIYALRDHADPARLAGELYLSLPYAILAEVAGVDGDPNAIAFFAVWPKGTCRAVGDAALFATGRFRAIARDLIGHVRGTLAPLMLQKGMRRIEARSIASYTAAHALLRRCGFSQEVVLKEFGADEPFLLFASCRSDWNRE